MKTEDPDVIYEDTDILAINKPAGLVVHSDGRTEESSLADWVKARHPSLKDVGGMHTLDSGRYIERWGIVHRLDRETSGVIVIAKHDEAFYFIQRQFLDRSIEKIYHAFVHGMPDPREGEVSLPIGRSRSDFRKWVTGHDARGTLRTALTHYRVLEVASSERYALLELSPKTGRTHQLRVHMGAIRHPIVCDARYKSAPALGFTRLALHAASLALRLPSGEQKVFIASLPGDFASAKAALRLS